MFHVTRTLDHGPTWNLRSSRVQQSICLRCFKSSAAHFVRHECRLVQRMLPHTFHSFAVNDSVIGSFNRLRRLGSRFHRRSLYVFKLNPRSRSDPPLNNKRYISFLRNGLIDKARVNYVINVLKDVKEKISKISSGISINLLRTYTYYSTRK